MFSFLRSFSLNRIHIKINWKKISPLSVDIAYRNIHQNGTICCTQWININHPKFCFFHFILWMRWCTAFNGDGSNIDWTSWLLPDVTDMREFLCYWWNLNNKLAMKLSWFVFIVSEAANYYCIFFFARILWNVIVMMEKHQHCYDK